MSHESKAKKQQILHAKQRAAQNFYPGLVKFLNELKVVAPIHSTRIDEQVARLKTADEKERRDILTKFGKSKTITEIFDKDLFVDDHKDTNQSLDKRWSRLTATPQKRLSTHFEYLVKLAKIALG
jgi:hypothetical protein